MSVIWYTAFLLGVLVFVFPPSPGFAKTYADPVNSTITASPTSVPADGATAATVAVTVKDSWKNPLPGDHIKIVSTPDTGIIINGGSVGQNHHTAATDGNGRVNFTVKSKNISPQTLTFTIYDTSDIPETVLGSVRIGFTPASLAPDTGCKDSAPVVAPVLSEAVPVGSTNVRLTWSSVPDPVSYYLVAYGMSPGVYTYGNPNVGGKETTSYTVAGLTPDRQYYFAVRPGNGCAPGSFSNELSAVAGARSSSPMPVITATPVPTIAKDVLTSTPVPIPVVPELFSSEKQEREVSVILPLLVGFLGIAIGAFVYWKAKVDSNELAGVNKEDQSVHEASD